MGSSKRVALFRLETLLAAGLETFVRIFIFVGMLLNTVNRILQRTPRSPEKISINTHKNYNKARPFLDVFRTRSKLMYQMFQVLANGVLKISWKNLGNLEFSLNLLFGSARGVLFAVTPVFNALDEL